jgi:hypothetical protein
VTVDEYGRPNTAEELDDLLSHLPTSEDPYDVAEQICVCVISIEPEVERTGDIYLLWACFTDWAELGPENEAQAHAAMRAAAAEWPRVKDDEATLDAYFDYWMYDVMDVQCALPDGWTMDMEEVSAGVYRVSARDRVGRSVTATGTFRGGLVHEVARKAEELGASPSP